MMFTVASNYGSKQFLKQKDKFLKYWDHIVVSTKWPKNMPNHVLWLLIMIILLCLYAIIMSISIPSYKPEGISECEYSLVYPSYGPQIAYPCPDKYPYQLNTYWTIKDHTRNYHQLLRNIQKAINFLQDNYNLTEDKIFKTNSIYTMSLIMQYLTCETEHDLRLIYGEWDGIERVRQLRFEYAGIHTKGFKTIKICFDRVKCIIDDKTGSITFNLFVDKLSEFKLQRLVQQYEYVEEDFINNDLGFHRGRDQQAYHVTLGSVDGRLHDTVKIMDELNHLILSGSGGKQNWGCIDIDDRPLIGDKLTCDSGKVDAWGKAIWETCVDLNA